MKIQSRILTASFEDRNKEGEVGYFVGQPIVFGSMSQDLGGFQEIIARGAWDTADVRECLAVFNHKEEALLGSTAAGTLRFANISDSGVDVEIDHAPTSISRDVQEWVKRGELTKMSFRFTIAENGSNWAYDEDTDTVIRTVTKFGKIYDVSPVLRPAYESTSLRAADQDIEAAKEFRKNLKPDQVINTRSYYEYKLKLNEYLR